MRRRGRTHLATMDDVRAQCSRGRSRPLSSVGQSTALVKRGSSVRIRQGAPLEKTPTRLFKPEPSWPVPATLRIPQPPGKRDDRGYRARRTSRCAVDIRPMGHPEDQHSIRLVIDVVQNPIAAATGAERSSELPFEGLANTPWVRGEIPVDEFDDGRGDPLRHRRHLTSGGRREDDLVAHAERLGTPNSRRICSSVRPSPFASSARAWAMVSRLSF